MLFLMPLVLYACCYLVLLHSMYAILEWHNSTITMMFHSIFSSTPVVVTKHIASPPNRGGGRGRGDEHNSGTASQFSTRGHNKQHQ